MDTNAKYKVSIIVPIYNVEKYLDECLCSLANQDIEKDEYEVLMVDDGSQDASNTIATKYSELYPNFKLFTKENGGVSSARNLAIEQAQGKYLMFVDADDWITANCLKGLLDYALSQQLDVCLFNWVEEVNGHTSQVYKASSLKGIVNGTQYLATKNFYGVIWNMIVKLELIRYNTIQFIPIMSGEDSAFALNVYEYAERMSHYDKVPIYHYRRERDGSVTSSHSVSHYRRMLESRISFLEWMHKNYPYNPNEKNYALYVNRKFNGVLMGAMCELLPKAYPINTITDYVQFAKRPFAFYRYGAEQGARKAVFMALQQTIKCYRLNQVVFRITKLLMQFTKR